MLAADTPRTPGSGRSRFSKMLPPPPPPTTRPPSKALPPVPLVLPPSFARKPIRKPVVAEKTLPEVLSPPQTLAKSTPPPTLPPQAPLPALPSLPPLPFETPLPPGPPPMSIPRRPLAPPKEIPAAPQPLPTLQTQHPEKAVAEAEAGRISPADSIGSLLSAYSRSSASDSIVKSSDGFASQRNSESTISPEAHEEVVKSWKSGKDSFAPLPTIPQDTWLPQATREAPKAPVTRSLKDLPPPPRLAAKDEPPPPTPKKDSIYVGKADSPVNTTAASPPREQIWRRRSLKSERPIQLPDLQLAALSHGSTAASQPPTQSTLPSAPSTLSSSTQSSQQALSASSAAGARAWQPQNKAYISPVEEKPSPEAAISPPQQQFKAYTPPMEQSRFFDNSAPVANTTSNIGTSSQTQKPLTEDTTMGAKASKIKTQASNFTLAKSSREQAETAPAPVPDHTTISPIEAPRLPTPDYDRQDVKPSMAETVVSPLSPTAPPTPPHDDTKPQSRPIQRKAIGEVAPPPANTQIRPAQSLPQLHAQPSPRASTEAPSPLRPPNARDFAPPLTPGFGGPRPSSRASSRPGSPASFAPRRGPGPGPGPGPRPYRPVITDFRELRVEDLPPPDPRALYFPRTVVEPAAPGTVFQPFPLGRSHMDCYTEHGIMKPSRNSCYPLACQTCGVADRTERWACAACHLRVCSGCNRLLGSNGRSVARVLEHLEQHGQRSPVAQEGQSPKGLGLTGM